MLIHSAKELALYMREQRKQQQLSQTEIGVASDVKQATISEFENKPDGTKLETVFKILAAANLELHILAKGEALPTGSTAWDEEW